MALEIAQTIVFGPAACGGRLLFFLDAGTSLDYFLLVFVSEGYCRRVSCLIS